MDYNSIIRLICDVFNRNSVQYMIVGGTAVALHGYYRQSVDANGKIADKPDLDFWYNPNYTNYFNLLAAVEELGKDVKEYREEVAPDPKKSFFQLEFEDYTLDLLPSIKASLTFRLSFARKETFDYEGVEIPFISFEDLIKDKEISARPKDINDIQHLRMR